MNDTITLPQSEFAAYQRAVKAAHDQIAALEADLARARAELAFVRDAYDQALRAVEAERAARRASEADAAQLREVALAYVTSARYEERARLRAELCVLATVGHPGRLLLNELDLLRELAADVARWREAGGDVRDLRYVLETMDKINQMKGASL